MKIKELFENSEQSNALVLGILKRLEYLPTTKKKIIYTKMPAVTTQTVDKLPAFSFAAAAEDIELDTFTLDGEHETHRKVKAGELIFSGPSKEKYSPLPRTIERAWQFQGDTAFPEQSSRLVARYVGMKKLEFFPPWDTTKKMPLLPGDYVVQDQEGRPYRIGRAEFEATYNLPAEAM